MINPLEKFIVFNIRKTYHELGKYEFKIVLDPQIFKTSQLIGMEMIDSDLRPMNFSVEKWGRKINCSFTIDEKVSDGVSRFCVQVKNSKGKEEKIQLSFWVIKP